VTPADARDKYGVVLDSQSKAIDGEATKRERANHRDANGEAAAKAAIKPEGLAAAGR
jgi:hypothetical protein